MAVCIYQSRCGIDILSLLCVLLHPKARRTSLSDLKQLTSLIINLELVDELAGLPSMRNSMLSPLQAILEHCLVNEEQAQRSFNSQCLVYEMICPLQ